MARNWLPPALLAVYALAFGWRALGGGLLVFDDHPGQFYRLIHAITLGPAPWRFDPGWWAGYAELQFYPPGFAWLGALAYQIGGWAAGGALSAVTVYQALLWLTWLLPGAAAFALLRRLLGDAWLALPGALVALTLSAGCRSGVEEGLHWGLIGARLGWGALFVLALALARWAEGGVRPPLTAAALVAAVTLLHPAHTPAAVAMIALAALAGAPRVRRLREGAALVALGLALTAVWLLPLLAHLDMALPLAWQDRSLPALAGRVLSQPILGVLAALAVIAWRSRSVLTGRWLLGLGPVMVALVVLDALVAEPLGVAWLPADRLLDGLHWVLVVAGALGLAGLAARAARPRLVIAAALAACLPLAWGPYEPGLSLWPRSGQWPKEAEITRGFRLDALWRALEAAPPGRVLFVRSALPLDWRPEWWRPHTHIGALAPLRAGRAIVGGTFTHPSPVAGLFYTGSAANRPLTGLAEQRDGRTLFGRPLADLDPAEFDRLAARLAVSAVVIPDEDAGTARLVVANPEIRRAARVAGLGVFVFGAARAVPIPAGFQRWRVPLPPGAAERVPLPIAYSPLWVARAGGQAVPLRRDDLGLVEASPPPGATEVELEQRPGAAEWTGVSVSLLAAVALGVAAVRRIGA